MVAHNSGGPRMDIIKEWKGAMTGLLADTVGIAVKISRAAQNSTFKHHPRDILRDENHLYVIVLVHII